MRSPNERPRCDGTGRGELAARGGAPRASGRPWTFYVLLAVFVLYVLALYGPMICIYALSFQDIRGGLVFPMKGLSLHWFTDLFTQVRTGDVKGAFDRSVKLAVIVTTITVVVSFLAGLGFRRRFRGDGIVFYLMIGSLVAPGLVLSIGTGLLLNFIGIEGHWYASAVGRDHVTEAELALDENGKFLGLRVSTIANLGGYISTFGPNIPTNLYGPLLAGVYTTPAIYCDVKVVFTNTVPVDAYRGAGRPEATFVLERLVDIAASEMRIDKAEIRRRNMIPKEAYPYQTPVMVEYDSGDPKGCMEKALAASDWDGFAKRKALSQDDGKLRGIGLCTYIEACGLAPSRIAGRLGARSGLYESATVRVHPTGQVTVLIGTHNHGQGHETTFAQIVSDKLGVPFENIDIVFGDTDRVQFGMGTYGSRPLVVGGAALSKASDKVILKGKKIAAHLLESSEQDIEFDAGVFTVAGTDRKKTFADIALAAYVPHNYPLEELEPGLEEQAYYDPVNFTYPGGAHIAEVEIDPETCLVKLVNYTAVDDVGTVINPMIVEGQLHGGIVQGIGQALFENCVYDDASGQLLSGSFMDYCMPRADNLPHMTVATHSTLCAHTPMGVKGCGEVGTIGSPAAVANAVVDALAHLGVSHVDMPATANRIWRIIQNASLLRAAE